MERGSTRHSPRIDEALASEVASLTRGAPVEARADEARAKEGPADGEPLPDALIRGDTAPPPGGSLDRDAIEARGELARSLRGSAFPGRRDELIAVARAEHAPDWVLETLSGLDPERRFETVQQVWVALGGEVEHRAPAEQAAAEPRARTEQVAAEPRAPTEQSRSEGHPTTPTPPEPASVCRRALGVAAGIASSLALLPARLLAPVLSAAGSAVRNGVDRLGDRR